MSTDKNPQSGQGQQQAQHDDKSSQPGAPNQGAPNQGDPKGQPEQEVAPKKQDGESPKPN